MLVLSPTVVRLQVIFENLTLPKVLKLLTKCATTNLVITMLHNPLRMVINASFTE